MEDGESTFSWHRGPNSASGGRAYYGAEKVGTPPLRDDGSSSDSVLDSGTAITFMVLLLRREIGLIRPAGRQQKRPQHKLRPCHSRHGLPPAVPPRPTAGRAVLSRPSLDCQGGSSTHCQSSLYGDDCHHCWKLSTSSYSIYRRFRRHIALSAGTFISGCHCESYLKLY